MDTEPPVAPSLAAVRLARAQRDAMVRRLHSAGLIALALMLVLAAGRKPHPGLQGESLGVLLSMAGVAAGGIAALTMNRSAGRLLLAPFVLLLAGTAGLIWLQPEGGAGGSWPSRAWWWSAWSWSWRPRRPICTDTS
jgi:hypothetical protein